MWHSGDTVICEPFPGFTWIKIFFELSNFCIYLILVTVWLFKIKIFIIIILDMVAFFKVAKPLP